MSEVIKTRYIVANALKEHKMKLSKATLSTIKYIVWTAIAAGLVALTGNLDHVGIPTLLVPVVAAILKGVATYVATEANEAKPDKE